MTDSTTHMPEATPPAEPIPAPVAVAGAEAVAAWQDFVDRSPPASRQIYRVAAGSFMRWLEAHGVPLPQVTPAVLADYLNRPNLNTSTRGVYRAALRRLFAALVGRGMLSANPVDEVKTNRQAGKQEDTPLTLAELTGYVHELALEPVEEGSEEFAAALVLLAGAYLGTRRVLPLSRVTGVHPRDVAVFAGRLRASGVWTPGGKTAGEWLDDECGQLAFWLDVWVAEGLFEK